MTTLCFIEHSSTAAEAIVMATTLPGRVSMNYSRCLLIAKSVGHCHIFARSRRVL